MTSTEINSVTGVDELCVPQWKQDLIVDLKKYKRTISSASGSVKLTVTVPKAMRPKLQYPKSAKVPEKVVVKKKEEILDAKALLESSKLIEANLQKKEVIHPAVECMENSKGTEEVLHKEETVHKKLKFNKNSKVVEEQDENNSLDRIQLKDSVKQYSVVDENLPAPGLVQSMKNKYLSMMPLEEKPNIIVRRCTSYENLESKNPFVLKKPRRINSSSGKLESDNINANCNELQNDELPKPFTVDTTKKLFEIQKGIPTAAEVNITESKTYGIWKNTNPFLKPPLMPKPPQRRINTTRMPPIKPPRAATQLYLRNPVVLNPFYNGVSSPTSPVNVFS